MSEPFLGEIKLVSFNFPPKGWAYCNGQILAISQNQALFSLLGTTYGGDGRTTFALPDLQGRVPIHTSQFHTLGERAGEETHTLAAVELPAHTHAVFASTADAELKSASGAMLAVSPVELYASGGTAAGLPESLTAVAGGSQAHTNMQPYLTLNFVIALQGIYPSRT